MKLGLQGLVLTGAMCVSSLLSSGQSSDTQSLNLQPSDTQYSNFPLISFEEGDYAHLDSAKMADIKNKEYPYKRYIPTADGINAYVPEQWESVIYDFQNFFDVQIYNLDFEVKNLNSEGDKKKNKRGKIVTVTNIPSLEVWDESGRYDSQVNLVTISNEEKYLGYSLKTAKNTALWNIISTNKFVRSVMLHEIAHSYIKQSIAELKMGGYSVNPVFLDERFSTPYSKFLNEGIAEYCPAVMGEQIQGEKEIPNSIDDLLNEKEKFNFYYCYSVHFVQDFLMDKGLHEGIRILLSNPPPTDKEIFNPELYFNRLNPPQKREEE